VAITNVVVQALTGLFFVRYTIAFTRASLPLRIRLSTLCTAIGVTLFNIFVPLMAIVLTLNERYRLGGSGGGNGGNSSSNSNSSSSTVDANTSRGTHYDGMTLRMICMSINFGIHGAIGEFALFPTLLPGLVHSHTCTFGCTFFFYFAAIPFLVNVFQNIWFYSYFHYILGLGGVLGCTMSIAESFRFEPVDHLVGKINNEEGESAGEKMLLLMTVVCLYGRAFSMLLTGVGLFTMNGAQLEEGMRVVSNGSRSERNNNQMIKYDSLARLEMTRIEGEEKEEEGEKEEEEEEEEEEEKEKTTETKETKETPDSKEIEPPQCRAPETTKHVRNNRNTRQDLDQEENDKQNQHIVTVGKAINEKKEAMEWLKVGHWSLILYACSFGFLLMVVQVTGHQLQALPKSTTTPMATMQSKNTALITGELLGFDVAWHVLFFGMLLTWHGMMTKNLLTLGIACGLVGSTGVTCGVGGWLLTNTGQKEIELFCTGLWICCGASFYLFGNCVWILKGMFS